MADAIRPTNMGEETIGERRSTSSSREKLLEAAVHIAIRDGVLAMTLDAVAKEAGVSKGGLIYHFPSKDDLIAAMLEYFRNRVLKSLEARMAADPNPRGRWLRTFLQAVFPPASDGAPAHAAPTEMAQFMTTMLVAFANNPHLLDPLRQTIGQRLEPLLAEGPNGLRQVALWPAVYGLLLWQHLGIVTRGDPLCQSMINELLTMAEGPAPSVLKE